MQTWIKISRCVECAAQFSLNDEFYSDGVCPYCGHVSGGSICDSVKSATLFDMPPWWQFWKKPVALRRKEPVSDDRRESL